MIQDNRKIVEPDLCAILDSLKHDINTEMRCISIGTIQSFDSTNQTATIALNYKRWISATSTTKSKTEDYPLLVKCPVFILNGGGAYITFPIAKGDSCLVLFCDREIDTWFTKGGTNAPQSARVHDLNDGIALVGIKNKGNFISSYYQGGVKLYSSGNIIITSVKDAIYLNDFCVVASNGLEVGTGATGTFSTSDGKVVSVSKGIVISIQ